jgi:hypothetical protein
MSFYGLGVMHHYHTIPPHGPGTRTKSMGVGDRVSVDDDGDSSEISEIPD